jgi:D-glycero-D-manno-heptose 1,7-bisphosphate phosphatase
MRSRALFLDRDGVINADHGYVHQIRDFEFIPGIFDLARAAIKQGYKIIVITNQAGIGRGLYSLAQFDELTAWMCQQFAEQGAPLAKVYFSPYHPTEGLGIFRKDDISRKPHPGMILEAQGDFDLDLASSVLVGDKTSDMAAGIAAGVGQNLLFSGQAPESWSGGAFQRIASLKEALGYLTGGHAGIEGP